MSITLILLVAGAVAGAIGLLAVKLYKLGASTAHDKLGIDLPTDPEALAIVQDVARDTFPVIVKEAVTGQLNPNEIIAAVEKGIADAKAGK